MTDPTRDPLVHVTVTVPASLLDLIDDMRGRCPRSEWLRVAATERLERLDREPDADGGAS